MVKLRLQQVSKTYNKDTPAVRDFNMKIKDKEFIVLVGPSGCGKSTLLRLIAGLEKLSEGHIFIDDKRINDVAIKDRDIAFVFQNYALYPHMNVYDNMAFGLKSRKVDKDEIDRRIREAAQMLELERYLARKPHALSGGQRQRVALGRAIVRNAKIFLMDEPLSNLDAKLRAQMRTEMKELHQRLQTTTLYVTHDQTEAMTMATRLIVMNEGEIQQVGSPKEVYAKPNNTFVGSFIGSPAMNFLTGHLLDEKLIIGKLSITLPALIKQSLSDQGYTNKKVIVGIRPEDIEIPTDFMSSANHALIDVLVDVIELLGAENIIHAHIEDQPFTIKIDTKREVKKGQILKLAIDLNSVHFFDEQTENRISLAGEI